MCLFTLANNSSVKHRHHECEARGQFSSCHYLIGSTDNFLLASLLGCSGVKKSASVRDGEETVELEVRYIDAADILETVI